MIGTIRRHQTWLWIVIVVLTVASFVIFGPTNAKIGDFLGGGTANYGMLNSKPIGADEFFDAKKEVLIRYFVANGQWPTRETESKFNPDLETYYRLMIIAKMKEYGVRIGDDEVARRVVQVLGQMPFDDLVQKILAPQGMTGEDFKRYIRNELGIQQLLAVAGLSGKLVTPQEAEELYRKEHQDISASIVFLSATNYLSQVKVTPEALTKFYNDRQANYRIPARVQVTYVKFDLTNYLADAKSQLTNLDTMVENSYQKNGTNLYREAKTPEEAKAKVRADILQKQETIDAHRVAGDFAVDLDKMEPRTADNLEKLAKERNLTVATSEPFNEEDGPQDLNVPTVFARNAFKLTAEDPFAGPIEGETGVYVMALKQNIPSEIPAMTNIEVRVTADYELAEAAKMARTAGTNFAFSASMGLGQGKSFPAVSAEAGLKSEALPPFSLSTHNLPTVEDRVNFGILKQVAFGIKTGTVSPFIPSRDGGIVVYSQALLPMDEEKLKKELPDFIAYVRQMRQSDAFNQWFNMQVNRDPGFKKTVEDAGNQMRSSTRPRS